MKSDIITLQRIVHIKELIEVTNAPRDKIYERDSSFRSAMTTLERPGTVVVKNMFHGQFDAVTGVTDERGDTHALIVMQVPKSRIIERGKGQYLCYETREIVDIDEFVITGYKPSEIIGVYGLSGLMFDDVYKTGPFGKSDEIKLDNRVEKFKFRVK